ncbi:MAG: hypothetical protein GXO43_01475 [Crenarchaeota archaeon]|nr:hypothetical protein [Thermoproteota archaeon]
MILYTLYEELRTSNKSADEFEELLRILAQVEAKVRYETLIQVLEVISKAKSENLDLKDLENIIADWISDASMFYEATLFDDPVYQHVVDKIKRFKKAES